MKLWYTIKTIKQKEYEERRSNVKNTQHRKSENEKTSMETNTNKPDSGHTR